MISPLAMQVDVTFKASRISRCQTSPFSNYLTNFHYITDEFPIYLVEVEFKKIISVLMHHLFADLVRK